ncbi:hypothetical protein TSUD_366580 [Trifolium subterraneum]|uniref:Putative plant transposon protein domain-containing protein n=1 Tax=Trifolium subterraneum TaxID=3900 RepID=A0A2Z6MQK9_TRISU|nr:hypothetical protein TSUD_366580 [Trifolium subterraneum]
MGWNLNGVVPAIVLRTMEREDIFKPVVQSQDIPCDTIVDLGEHEKEEDVKQSSSSKRAYKKKRKKWKVKRKKRLPHPDVKHRDVKQAHNPRIMDRQAIDVNQHYMRKRRQNEPGEIRKIRHQTPARRAMPWCAARRTTRNVKVILRDLRVAQYIPTRRAGELSKQGKFSDICASRRPCYAPRRRKFEKLKCNGHLRVAQDSLARRAGNWPERELTWGERFVQNNLGYMAPTSEKFFRDVNRDRYLKLKSLKINQEKGFKDGLRELSAIYGELERRGWLRFNELMERGKAKENLDIVREFYVNAFQGDVNRKVYVRGVLVDYSGDAINRLLRTVRVQECAYMPLSNTCSSMLIRERKEIRSFVGRPSAPWYKYYGGSAPTKIHIHHFNPIGRAWAEWVMHNLAPVANITEIQLPNALLVKMIMDQSDIDLGEILSMDIRKIARVERPGVRLGHCNLIFALCKARGVPELDEDADILPVAPLTLIYFRTFRSSPVPAAEREQFVEEEDPDEDHEGDEVEDYLNDNVNENEGRDQEEDALMAEIDGFEGVSQHHEAPQCGYHYTHHEDELARMLHELDLYRSTGATHIYYNQQGALYRDAMRYREEHPPPSDYELYPTRGEWENYVHNDRERYEGMILRRSREWERSYLAHNPPMGTFGQSGYVPQGEEGPSHGYGDAEENPNLFCDVSDFGFGNVDEANVRSETNPDAPNPPSRTPQ